AIRREEGRVGGEDDRRLLRAEQAGHLVLGAPLRAVGRDQRLGGDVERQTRGESDRDDRRRERGGQDLEGGLEEEEGDAPHGGESYGVRPLRGCLRLPAHRLQKASSGSPPCAAPKAASA